MIEVFEVATVPQGAVVIEEGPSGAEAYIVARGELEVKRTFEREDPMVLARLTGGALFGEMALLSRAPRAASVVACRPSILLVGRKDALDAVAEREPDVAFQLATHCRRRMVQNLVRTSPVFSAVRADERPALVERFETRVFEKGDKLISRGAPRPGFISSLRARSRSSATRGEPFVLATLKPGDIVGEVALVLRRPASADVVAVYPTVTLASRERTVHLAHPRAPDHPRRALRFGSQARRRDPQRGRARVDERRRLHFGLSVDFRDSHEQAWFHHRSLGAIAPTRRRGKATIHGPRASPSEAVVLVLGVTAVFFGVQFVGAILGQQRRAAREALHLLTDVAALGMAFAAMRVAVRRPTARFTYGLRRAEPVAAIFNALLVLGATAFLVTEAIDNLSGGAAPRADRMLYIAAVGLVVSSISAWLIHGAIGAHGDGEPRVMLTGMDTGMGMGTGMGTQAPARTRRSTAW